MPPPKHRRHIGEARGLQCPQKGFLHLPAGHLQPLLPVLPQLLPQNLQEAVPHPLLQDATATEGLLQLPPQAIQVQGNQGATGGLHHGNATQLGKVHFPSSGSEGEATPEEAGRFISLISSTKAFVSWNLR